eukprot:CAMPEP_0170538902 /NCGR_PEP_ID=MMETSP0209-20121228/103595_1 /TAXON_ID=665100 ORGANISM="Litonotus pictus, Strain P1" /NCGR_SAMPLE_ID=MMETSP0209 /ASSEMBLY_ACC=CAM_ASM_000301 /LENGTH=3866 /DNA_ID=CAMNT_0010840703 /DNA_START=1009 /DNA_END=12609 /DNA_ORIENTATION=+
MTSDNFLKMVLIYKRAKARIPIVILGETGCGKTSLVKFLVEELLDSKKLRIINFHAGLSEEMIIEEFSKVETLCSELNRKNHGQGQEEILDSDIYWVFLDEINTCNHQGLINEILVQRSIYGKMLDQRIVTVAVCNPFKVNQRKEISEAKKHQYSAQDLVYTVHPLQDPLLDYVWDYGVLKEEEERKYIEKMLIKENNREEILFREIYQLLTIIEGNGISNNNSNSNRKNLFLSSSLSNHLFTKTTLFDPLFVKLVMKSQNFVRELNKEQDYSVSLRDVNRVKLLKDFFFSMIYHREISVLSQRKERMQSNEKKMTTTFNFQKTMESSSNPESIKPSQILNRIHFKSLLLSLLLCYQSRINEASDKEDYMSMIVDEVDSLKEEIASKYEEKNSNPKGNSMIIIPSSSYSDYDRNRSSHINSNNTETINNTILNEYSLTDNDLKNFLRTEQDLLISKMELPEGIAKNTSLKENVFILFVSILNQIPLFIFGKPGSSKSLAVNIILSNMQGEESSEPFFKILPKIVSFPYQGSLSSSSEGIEKVFRKAYQYMFSSLSYSLKNTQNSGNSSKSEASSGLHHKEDCFERLKDLKFLPLIVFDEIGLAEKSKLNPLKVLHALLEPQYSQLYQEEFLSSASNNSNSQYQSEIIVNTASNKEKIDLRKLLTEEFSLLRPAFVGISNSNLDAAKMNRALFQARPDPSAEDLVYTGKTTFLEFLKNADLLTKQSDRRDNSLIDINNMIQTNNEESLDPEFDYSNFKEELMVIEKLSKAYFELIERQNRNETSLEKNPVSSNFHGTRDFYSLIKSVSRAYCRIVQNSNTDSFYGQKGKLNKVSKGDIFKMNPKSPNLNGPGNEGASFSRRKGESTIEAWQNDIVLCVLRNFSGREVCSNGKDGENEFKKQEQGIMIVSNGDKDKLLLDNDTSPQVFLLKKLIQEGVTSNKYLFNIKAIDDNTRLEYSISQEVDSQLRSYSPLKLFLSNLNDKHSRFLLIFYKSESALYLLNKIVFEQESTENKKLMIGSMFPADNPNTQYSNSPNSFTANNNDRIDLSKLSQHKNYSYKTLSEIISHMELGNSIILSNQDQIYGALFDLFNQNFSVVGKKRHCRIALGSNSNPLCHVQDKFNCIVFTQVDSLNTLEPAFLNRFEKHFLDYGALMNETQLKLVSQLNDFINSITLRGLLMSLLVSSNSKDFVEGVVISEYREEKKDDENLLTMKQKIVRLASVDLVVLNSLIYNEVITEESDTKEELSSEKPLLHNDQDKEDIENSKNNEDKEDNEDTNIAEVRSIWKESVNVEDILLLEKGIFEYSVQDSLNNYLQFSFETMYTQVERIYGSSSPHTILYSDGIIEDIVNQNSQKNNDKVNQLETDEIDIDTEALSNNVLNSISEMITMRTFIYSFSGILENLPIDLDIQTHSLFFKFELFSRVLADCIEAFKEQYRKKSEEQKAHKDINNISNDFDINEVYDPNKADLDSEEKSVSEDRENLSIAEEEIEAPLLSLSLLQRITFHNIETLLISGFYSIRDFALRIESFFNNPDKALLIVKIDSATELGFIPLVKYLFEEKKGEYLNQIKRVFMEKYCNSNDNSNQSDFLNKNIVVIVHMKYELNKDICIPSQFNSDWEQITIDSLVGGLGGIFKKSLLKNTDQLIMDFVEDNSFLIKLLENLSLRIRLKNGNSDSMSIDDPNNDKKINKKKNTKNQEDTANENDGLKKVKLLLAVDKSLLSKEMKLFFSHLRLLLTEGKTNFNSDSSHDLGNGLINLIQIKLIQIIKAGNIGGGNLKGNNVMEQWRKDIISVFYKRHNSKEDILKPISSEKGEKTKENCCQIVSLLSSNIQKIITEPLFNVLLSIFKESSFLSFLSCQSSFNPTMINTQSNNNNDPIDSILNKIRLHFCHHIWTEKFLALNITHHSFDASSSKIVHPSNPCTSVAASNSQYSVNYLVGLLFPFSYNSMNLLFSDIHSQSEQIHNLRNLEKELSLYYDIGMVSSKDILSYKKISYSIKAKLNSIVVGLIEKKSLEQQIEDFIINNKKDQMLELTGLNIDSESLVKNVSSQIYTILSSDVLSLFFHSVLKSSYFITSIMRRMVESMLNNSLSDTGEVFLFVVKNCYCMNILKEIVERMIFNSLIKESEVVYLFDRYNEVVYGRKEKPTGRKLIQEVKVEEKVHWESSLLLQMSNYLTILLLTRVNNFAFELKESQKGTANLQDSKTNDMKDQSLLNLAYIEFNFIEVNKPSLLERCFDRFLSLVDCLLSLNTYLEKKFNTKCELSALLYIIKDLFLVIEASLGKKKEENLYSKKKIVLDIILMFSEFNIEKLLEAYIVINSNKKHTLFEEFNKQIYSLIVTWLDYINDTEPSETNNTNTNNQNNLKGNKLIRDFTFNTIRKGLLYCTDKTLRNSLLKRLFSNKDFLNQSFNIFYSIFVSYIDNYSLYVSSISLDHPNEQKAAFEVDNIFIENNCLMQEIDGFLSIKDSNSIPFCFMVDFFLKISHETMFKSTGKERVSNNSTHSEGRIASISLALEMYFQIFCNYLLKFLYIEVELITAGKVSEKSSAKLYNSGKEKGRFSINSNYVLYIGFLKNYIQLFGELISLISLDVNIQISLYSKHSSYIVKDYYVFLIKFFKEDSIIDTLLLLKDLLNKETVIESNSNDNTNDTNSPSNKKLKDRDQVPNSLSFPDLVIQELKDKLSDSLNKALLSSLSFTLTRLREIICKPLIRKLGSFSLFKNLPISELLLDFLPPYLDLLSSSVNSLELKPFLPYLNNEKEKEFNVLIENFFMNSSPQSQAAKDFIQELASSSINKFLFLQFLINTVFLNNSNDKLKVTVISKKSKALIKAPELKNSFLGVFTEKGYYFMLLLIDNFTSIASKDQHSYYFSVRSNKTKGVIGSIIASCFLYALFLCFPNNKYFNGLKFPEINSTFLPALFVIRDQSSQLIKDIYDYVHYNPSIVGVYKCSCNYIYFLMGCTMPAVLDNCPKCKAKIGGQGHILLKRAGHEAILNAEFFQVLPKMNKAKADLASIMRKDGVIVDAYNLRNISLIRENNDCLNYEGVGTYRFFCFTENSILMMETILADYISRENGSSTNKNSFVKIFNSKINENKFENIEKIIEYFEANIKRDFDILSKTLNSLDTYIIVIKLIDFMMRKLEEDPQKTKFSEIKQILDLQALFKLEVPRLKGSIEKEVKAYKEAGQSNDSSLNINDIDKYNFRFLTEENYSQILFDSSVNNQSNESIDNSLLAVPQYRLLRALRFLECGNTHSLEIIISSSTGYPLLKHFYSNLDSLVKLRKLYPIIQFSNYALNKFNLVYSRDQCKKLTLEPFLKEDKTFNRLYQEFKEAWKVVGKDSVQHACYQFEQKEICDSNNNDGNVGTPFEQTEGSLYWLLSDITVLPNSNNLEEGRYIPAAFRFLGEIQSKFLLTIRESEELNRIFTFFTKEQRENLGDNEEPEQDLDIDDIEIENNNENQRVPPNNIASTKVPIHKAIMFDIINIDIEEFEVLSERFARYYDIYNHNFDSFRSNNNIKYDLKQIEKEIAVKYLSTVKDLDYESVVKVQYKYEALNLNSAESQLVDQLKTKLPQVKLDSFMKDRLERYLGGLSKERMIELYDEMTKVLIHFNQFETEELFGRLVMVERKVSSNDPNFKLELKRTACDFSLNQLIEGKSKSNDEKEKEKEKIASAFREYAMFSREEVFLLLKSLDEESSSNKKNSNNTGESSILLCQLLDFFFLIEEYIFPHLLENISEAYKVQINQVQRDSLTDILSSNNDTGFIESLARIMRRFIIRFLILFLETTISLDDYLQKADLYDIIPEKLTETILKEKAQYFDDQEYELDDKILLFAEMMGKEVYLMHSVDFLALLNEELLVRKKSKSTTVVLSN